MSSPIFGQGAVEATTQAITLGATAQVVFAQNSSRHYMSFTNSSDTIMYLRLHDTEVATAVLGIPVAAAATVSWYGPGVPTNRLTVLCATTAKTFYAFQG